MSTDAEIWELIERLASALDGSRDVSEETLDKLEAELRSIRRANRDEIRRQMILIVASLSRLEVRLIDSDGPLDTAV